MIDLSRPRGRCPLSWCSESFSHRTWFCEIIELFTTQKQGVITLRRRAPQPFKVVLERPIALSSFFPSHHNHSNHPSSFLIRLRFFFFFSSSDLNLLQSTKSVHVQSWWIQSSIFPSICFHESFPFSQTTPVAL